MIPILNSFHTIKIVDIIVAYGVCYVCREMEFNVFGQQETGCQNVNNTKTSKSDSSLSDDNNKTEVI